MVSHLCVCVFQDCDADVCAEDVLQVEGFQSSKLDEFVVRR